MKITLTWMLVAATAACLEATALRAATLEAVQGQVLVNRGSGYRFEVGSTELKPGDMIIANAGASAHITYGDGCVVPVEAGSVTTVAERSPCATQSGNSLGLSPATLGIGAVAVGASIGVAALLGSGGDKPASP